MSASRESLDLFRKRGIKSIIRTIKFGWRTRYFWQDTFLTRFHRWIWCSHKTAEYINDPNEPKKYFCFNCYREITAQQ